MEKIQFLGVYLKGTAGQLRSNLFVIIFIAAFYIIAKETAKDKQQTTKPKCFALWEWWNNWSIAT